MSLEDAQSIIAAVCLHSKKFRPIGEPTLTPRGARIEFVKVDVDPKTVVHWFDTVGVKVTMIGYNGLYGGTPSMIAEFQS